MVHARGRKFPSGTMMDDRHGQNYNDDEDKQQHHNPPADEPLLESLVFPDVIDAANDASKNDQAGA